MENFDEKFSSFLDGVRKIYNDYMDLSFPTNPKDVIEYTEGKRYIRVIRKRSADSQYGSAHLFVDKTNGDVLKTASYSSPAKGARGNIFDAHNGLARISAYGAEYNR